MASGKKQVTVFVSSMRPQSWRTPLNAIIGLTEMMVTNVAGVRHAKGAGGRFLSASIATGRAQGRPGLVGYRVRHRRTIRRQPGAMQSQSLIAIDPSEGSSRPRVRQSRPPSRFEVGDAQALALETASRDAVVSALMLNLVRDKLKALSEMKRAARAGGTSGFTFRTTRRRRRVHACFLGCSGGPRPRGAGAHRGEALSLLHAGSSGGLDERGRLDAHSLQTDRDAHGIHRLRGLLAPVHVGRKAGAGLLCKFRSRGPAAIKSRSTQWQFDLKLGSHRFPSS